MTTKGYFTGLNSLCTVAVAVLLAVPAGAQAQRYFDEVSAVRVPDSSQQIADRIIESTAPVVVDFWAPWCGPCRMINPILVKLEKAYAGRVMFMKVNVDYHRKISAYFGIQGIPAVYVIRDKEVKRALMGMRPEAEYKKAIEEVLAMKPAASAKPDTTKKQDTVKKNAAPKKPAPKSPKKKN
jgi:thioredoxin 1